MTPSQDIILQVIGRAQQCGCPRAGAMEPHSILADDLGWTPIDLHFLASDLEDGFDIDFPVDEELSWRTVADICRAVESRTNPPRTGEGDHPQDGGGAPAPTESLTA